MDELGVAILLRTEERVRDVTAVELADREQVDHRDEQPAHAPNAIG